MSRMIDADNLWEVLRGEEGAKALNHSPVKLIDIKQIIDNTPTIDAIPVEWLEEHDGEDISDSDGNSYGRRRITVVEALSMWQKEQEATKNGH